MMSVSLAFLIVVNAFLLSPAEAAEGETAIRDHHVKGKKLAEEGDLVNRHNRGCLASQRCRDGED